MYLSDAIEPLICSNGSDFQVGKLLLYGLTDVVGPFKIVQVNQACLYQIVFESKIKYLLEIPPNLVQSCFKPRLLTPRTWTRKTELKPTAAFGIVEGEFSIVICDVCCQNFTLCLRNG